MKSKKFWSVAVIILTLATGSFLYINKTQISAQNAAASDVTAGTTVAVQSADSILSEVSAAGRLDLRQRFSVAPDVSGVVEEIVAAVGDQVKAGDTLLTLNTADMERAVLRADLALEASSNAFAQLAEAASAADIAVAQAKLQEAQETLADVQTGPSADEIAAAESNLAAMAAKYNELQAGPSEAELTQLSADLKKKEVALAEAQRAYDQVAWRENVGMTAEASTLQQATIDYEAAAAAYTEATAPADSSTLQSALSSIQSAQVSLTDLRNSPSAADLSTAQAQVADAQAGLDELMAGADETDLRDAEIGLEQALLDLEEAHADLAAATIKAPVDGTVLAINVGMGERAGEGSVAVTLADTAQLELTIDVAEVDIVKVAVGQPVEIAIDALSGQSFAGEVETIAPASDDESGVVSYPVTIRLTDENLTGVRAGMTAVATIRNTQDVEDSWLVPTSAIQTNAGATSVTVLRAGAPVTVAVSPGAVQGEWTVVKAPALQSGDQVTATLTSYVGVETTEPGGMGGPPDGAGGPPPVRPLD